MATNLTSANSFPYIYVVSVGTTWNEIQLPTGAKRVTIGASAALYVGQNGASDSGAVGTHKAFVTSNNYLELELKNDSQRASSVFVAAQTGTVAVSIILE
jgi:hypothetical protein